MRPTDFGTEAFPLRASKLPALLRCPRGALIEMMAESDSGPAADTGSAVHLAVAEFHRNRGDVAAAIKAMIDNLKEYPLADLGTAEGHFRCYAKDPRNAEARVILCEERICVRLPAPEGDTPATEIVINGTLDQVREEGGSLTVWDVKTGGMLEGIDMLPYHAAQLAAYQVGATLALARPVNRAGVIRTRDYLKTDRKKQPKPGPVFWQGPWSLADAKLILEHVRQVVGDIRRGQIAVAPSAENCRYCPAGNVANCLRRAF